MSLVAEQVTFSYPKSPQVVLKETSVEFFADEIAALTGPNGCGKTTLVKLLLGILTPQSGRVLLDGTNVSELTLAEVGRLIGYVMQNPAQQLFCTTVAEEMAYGLKNQGLEAAEIDSRTDYYLDYFQLTQHRESFPFHLSQGEKQRLVLAAVLAMRPRYLMLDEPTAHLDVHRRQLLGELILQIRKELGCGIIVVSHDEGFVRRYCQREVHLKGVCGHV